MGFMMVEKDFLLLLKAKYFQIKIEGTGFSGKVSDHSNLTALTLKQVLQGLPIALPQGKAGNTSENLINEIIKKTYILCSEQRKSLKKYIII